VGIRLADHAVTDLLRQWFACDLGQCVMHQALRTFLRFLQSLRWSHCSGQLRGESEQLRPHVGEHLAPIGDGHRRSDHRASQFGDLELGLVGLRFGEARALFLEGAFGVLPGDAPAGQRGQVETRDAAVLVALVDRAAGREPAIERLS
jgi:hypothetical protein